MICGESDHSPSIEVSNLGRWLILNIVAKALAYYFMVHDRDDSVVWAALIFVYASTALVFLTFHRMKVARVKLNVDEGEHEWTTAVGAYVLSVVAFSAFAHIIDHSVHVGIRANAWSPATCNRYIASVVGAGAAEWERRSTVGRAQTTDYIVDDDGGGGDYENAMSSPLNPPRGTVGAKKDGGGGGGGGGGSGGGGGGGGGGGDEDSSSGTGDSAQRANNVQHSDDPFERVVALRLSEARRAAANFLHSNAADNDARRRRRGIPTTIASSLLTGDHLRAVARLIREGEFTKHDDGDGAESGRGDGADDGTTDRVLARRRHSADRQFDDFGVHVDQRLAAERRAIAESTVSSPLVHVLFASMLLLDAVAYVYTSRFATVMHNSGAYGTLGGSF